MEVLRLKKTVIYEDKIVMLRKKADIEIGVSNIDFITYRKPTFWNYFWAGLFDTTDYPGYLKIYLHKKAGNSKLHLIRISFEDFRKLPESFKKKLL